MTDRVLTKDEVNTTERLAMQHSSQPRILAKPCVELCVSHRLLQQQVNELEKEIKSMDEDLQDLAKKCLSHD